MGFFSKKKVEPAVTPGVIARFEGPGRFELDIVGESHYQDILEKLCSGRTVNGHRKEVEAVLIHNDDNPYDDKAVAVAIDDDIVRFLDRKRARTFRARMVEAGAAGVPGSCRANIVGGWDRGDDDVGHFGVKLDLPKEPDEDESE